MTLTNEHDPKGDDIYQNVATVQLSEDQRKVSGYRLATGILGVLCVVLLMTVIGMAVLILNVPRPNVKRPSRSCPSGWKALEHTCFYFPETHSKIRKGWIESRADCVQRGADLTAVDTCEKQKFISQILNALHETANGLDGYWIGLRDKVNEQTWTWINGCPLTEGYWKDGEPNDYGSIAEDCAATYPTNNSMKSWNDAPCSHPLWWICEKEASETSKGN